ncbi:MULTISPECIES: ESX secretion-associated protein EspG [Nocardia]|uniref:ESX secretion-associated protein EspG n=2 Tax=Nocardia TaxID=1817 RepID=A0A2T2Z1J9_9NOCA|nr:MULTISPECIES: ESX secretion-associated protein EspG [Nocardia]MBF6447046.1 ESX secretion-associated protein EspG [Nocardia elegans]PSR61638.1 hypothetical protein C8259_19035 [Nocardia nova]
MKWEFTPDEFMHVWKETDRDRYPFPLQLRSSAEWQSDYDRMHSEFRLRMPRGFDPDLSAALRLVSNPPMSLLLIGARKRPVRFYAGIDTAAGVTLVQRPGPVEEHGGNVVIEFGSSAIATKVFAAVLGSLPAGRRPAMVESLDRIRTDLESWTGTKETTTDRMKKLLQAPRMGSGHIEVRCGLEDPRPYPPQYLSWFDVEGDGRYTYREQYNEFRIDPSSTDDICREVTRMMEVQQEFSRTD